MPTTLRNTDILFNDSSTQPTAATGFGFKNRIINGAMMIDQRNAGASITGNDGFFPVDRFTILATQTSKLTVQQSTVAPTGFTNSFLATSSSAYSVLSRDQFTIQQRIEGFNTSDLGFGSASASTVTLSFWVRSSLTGTFGGALTNNAYNRSYPFSYVINSANTWEQKTVTIAGDTTGTWVGATNGVGLRVSWSLGAGSTYLGTANSWAASAALGVTGQTNLVGTNGATFYITGVQLEKGSTATSFDYRPYGTELMLCQRYYQEVGTAASNTILYLFYASGTGTYYLPMTLPITMRAAPTAIIFGTWGSNNIYAFGINATTNNFRLDISASVAGNTYVQNSGANSKLTFSSEL